MLNNLFTTNLIYKKLYSTFKSMNKLKFIHALFALIVIAWLNQGIFTFLMPYLINYIRWGLFFIWFGMALFLNKKFVSTFFIQCWPLLLFSLYIIIISLFVKKSFINVYIQNILYLIMIYSIFLYYFNESCKRFQKVLVSFIFLDYVLVGINTYIHLIKNPLVSRYLSMGLPVSKQLLGPGNFYGVGSHGYAYSLVAIILLFGFLFFNFRNKKVYKVLTILMSIAFMTLLIKIAFTMAILLMTIFFILIIVIGYTNKRTFIVITIVGFVMFIIFHSFFSYMFINISEIKSIPKEVSVRLMEISQFLSGNKMAGTDLNGRLNLYSQSVDAFKNNIYFGIVFNSSNTYEAGGHSAWLDLLANFGLPSILFFMFLFKAYKYCEKNIILEFKLFLRVYWLYFVSLGVINTLLFSTFFTMWFLFLPLFIVSIGEKIKDNVSILIKPAVRK